MFRYGVYADNEVKKPIAPYALALLDSGDPVTRGISCELFEHFEIGQTKGESQIVVDLLAKIGEDKFQGNVEVLDILTQCHAHWALITETLFPLRNDERKIDEETGASLSTKIRELLASHREANELTEALLQTVESADSSLDEKRQALDKISLIAIPGGRVLARIVRVLRETESPEVRQAAGECTALLAHVSWEICDSFVLMSEDFFPLILPFFSGNEALQNRLRCVEAMRSIETFHRVIPGETDELRVDQIYEWQGSENHALSNAADRLRKHYNLPCRRNKG